jgi:PadR family transcriptional regulator PadR
MGTGYLNINFMENKELDIENTKAQMRKGILEFCILLIISKEEVYPSDILKELKEFNLIVVEGTLYPLLSRLKDGGLLEYRWEESKSGPPRKYYKLTDTGKNTLKQLEKNWQELSKSIHSLIKKHYDE